MMIPVLTCVFLPFLASLLILAFRKNGAFQHVVVILTGLTVFLSALGLAFGGNGEGATVLSLHFAQSGFQCVYAVVTAFMWLCAALLSPQYFQGHHKVERYYFFYLLTFGATMGVFLSADLMTTFVFFEIMSFASYMWVVQEQDSEAMAAGKTYLVIAVLGGMVLLMGLFLLYNITGTLTITELYGAVSAAGGSTRLYAAAFCMLFGFGAKAGLYPLHIWLPKAHPVAPAPASALLSGILTKTGVFGILVVTANVMRGDPLWGYVLLVLGSITMVLGAVIAVFSVNLKRTLACSSLSQIGFITVGISMLTLLGEENGLAASGTVLYMLNHSIVKLVLFLAAGAIYAGAHTLDLNELKGYGRKKPEIMIPFLFGACSLAGVPGFAGYLSKTLVHESIVEYAAQGGPLITAVEWLFLFSGGLTAAYMLKLFLTIFVEKPTEATPVSHEKTSFLSTLALALSAVMLPVVGLLPHALADRISGVMIPFVNGAPISHPVAYFSLENLKGVAISLAIGVLVYVLVIRQLLMKTENGRKLHYNPLAGKFSLEDNVYVPLLKGLSFLLTVVFRFCCDIVDLFLLLLSKTVLRLAKEPTEPHRRKYAYAVGSLYGTLRKRDPEEQGQRLSEASETISKTTRQLSKGFSFALLMTCFGVVLILLFLIFFHR